MVKIALEVKMTLENIEEVKTSGSDFRWCLKFACCNCREISDKWNYVSLDEFTNSERRNAIIHFTSKCKLCSRENFMTILKDSIKTYSKSDDGQFKTIVVFDCRGLEPCAFSASEGWIAKTINDGTEFKDVDLNDTTWVEYCDKIHEPVTISNIEYKFTKVK